MDSFSLLTMDESQVPSNFQRKKNKCILYHYLQLKGGKEKHNMLNCTVQLNMSPLSRPSATLFFLPLLSPNSPCRQGHSI